MKQKPPFLFTLVTFVALSAIAVPALAQTPSLSATNAGSFRGRIIDADTGQPATQQLTIVVTKLGESGATRREMDVSGEFVVPNLSPGRYQLQFRENGFEFETPRYVQVTGIAPVTPVDIYLRLLAGGINGVVLDEDREPVQGSRVLLVTVQYLGGQAIYTLYTSAKNTDDRGSFSLARRLEAGHPYFLLVLPPEATRPTLSGTPSLEANWYPGRPGFSDPFVLRSDELKRVDIVLKKKQTHCVDGTLTENGQPAALNFEIAIPEVAGYLGFTGGTPGVISRGQSDALGHFQACGLWPGEFLVAAGMSKTPDRPPVTMLPAPASYGRSVVSIADSDMHDVKLDAHSPVGLNSEIHLDSAQPSAETYRLNFIPLSRVAFESQPFLANFVDVTAPSQFTLSLLPSTDYLIGLRNLDGSSDAYLKDVTCGGITRRNSIKLGDTDCGLHITIGTDMGKLSATVVDKNNNVDLNSVVCVYPTSAVTREEIALTGTCSSSEPGTMPISLALRPDKYFAVVMPPGTPDWIEYILTNRGPHELIEILARSTSPLTIKSSPAR